jgi:Na+-driven multidrug efflux pump
MIFPRAFVSIFTPDAALIEFATKALRIYFSGMVLFGIQIASQMTFVSLGNAPCSILVAVVRKFVLLLPLIYVMPKLMSDRTAGVYTAEPIADILAVTFTSILFVYQFKKAIGKIESKGCGVTENDQK